MLSLLTETVRRELMQQAGCDPSRCGLVAMRPAAGGLETLEHHRRLKPTGKSDKRIAARAVTATDTQDDLAAWMREQHAD